MPTPRKKKSERPVHSLKFWQRGNLHTNQDEFVWKKRGPPATCPVRREYEIERKLLTRSFMKFDCVSWRWMMNETIAPA
jgi:hypothetical protein